MQLINTLNFAMTAHAEHALTPKKKTRKWDRKTPYGIHPTWCALTILHETALPEIVRLAGAQALALHDILEDTTAELPEWIPEEVRVLVCDMSFAGGFAQEMKEVWEKPPLIRLLKLYDKVSNLMDGVWMSDDKKEQYHHFVHALTSDVEKNYGALNITIIARAICAR